MLEKSYSSPRELISFKVIFAKLLSWSTSIRRIYFLLDSSHAKKSEKTPKWFSWSPYFLWYFRSEFVYIYLCLAGCVRAKSQSRDPVHEQRCQTYHNSFQWKWLVLLVTPSQQTSSIFKRRAVLYSIQVVINVIIQKKIKSAREKNPVLLSHPHGLCVNTIKSGSVVLSTKVMHV